MHYLLNSLELFFLPNISPFSWFLQVFCLLTFLWPTLFVFLVWLFWSLIFYCIIVVVSRIRPCLVSMSSLHMYRYSWFLWAVCLLTFLWPFLFVYPVWLFWSLIFYFIIVVVSRIRPCWVSMAVFTCTANLFFLGSYGLFVFWPFFGLPFLSPLCDCSSSWSFILLIFLIHIFSSDTQACFALVTSYNMACFALVTST